MNYQRLAITLFGLNKDKSQVRENSFENKKKKNSCDLYVMYTLFIFTIHTVKID